MKSTSEKEVYRLILYKKLLKEFQSESVRNIFSHNLAEQASLNPAQIRRDLMLVGYEGSTVSGYNVNDLLLYIEKFLYPDRMQNVALIGLGNLGKSILDYCYGRHPFIAINTIFEKDPNKINRIICGTRCYNIDDLESIIKKNMITISIIAIPFSDAQNIAQRLIDCDVKSIINYSTANLRLPSDIYVENRDMMIAVEKAAFFAKKEKEI
jgi:redox-sensing transcriptional repressor